MASTAKYVYASSDAQYGAEIRGGNGLPGTAFLLADIAPGAAGSSPTNLASIGGGKAMFGAISANGVGQAWITDGTPEGTVLLANLPGDAPLFPGASGTPSIPSDFAGLPGGGAVFAANSGAGGRELWRTDGTPEGTYVLKDLNPGSAASAPGGFATLPNGRLVFHATDAQHGQELWTTDGTAEGTVRLTEIVPGAGSSTIGTPVKVGGGAVFSATDATGAKLWFTDGTAEGTYKLSDAAASGVTALGGGRAIFTGTDAGHGAEAWVTDGTQAGTHLLSDVVPGADSSSARGFVATGQGEALFFVGAPNQQAHEIWHTDGTAAGTQRLYYADIGAAGSDLRAMTSIGDGKALFVTTGSTGSTGAQVWITDGTPEGTHSLGDFASVGPRFGAINVSSLGGGQALFQADRGDGTGNHVYYTDGTAAGTVVYGDGVVAGKLIDLSPPQVVELPFSETGSTSISLTAAELKGLQASGAVFDVPSATQSVHLADATLSFGTDTDEAFLARLYGGLLHREGDVGGLSNWGEALESGASRASVTANFLASDEFRGARANESDATFVDSLYREVLGREGDAGGVAFHLASLAAGTSRADVAVGFVDSAEAKANFSPLTSAGVLVLDKDASYVHALYETVLGRTGEGTGIAGHVAALNSDLTLDQLADNFVGSGESMARHAGQDDAAFVAQLYHDGLHREAGQSEIDFWVGTMQTQGFDRTDVAASIAFSTEAQTEMHWML